MQFRLITWNINSVRRRVDLVKKLTESYSPDILCLQEIKCTEDQFPFKALRNCGYEYFEISGQKAYHGVATLSKIPIKHIKSHDFNGTGEARHISVEVVNEAAEQPLILHNFYVPAGGDEPDINVNPKFAQKLNYLNSMSEVFSKYRNKKKNKLILVGDLNVAPLEHDVWSHKQLLKVVSHTPVEVEHMEMLQKSHSWTDIMRLHVPEDEKLYTWWSYRAKDWRKSNRGRRLDHIWVSPAISQTSKDMMIADEARDWDSASDHAPVIVDFDLSAHNEGS